MSGDEIGVFGFWSFEERERWGRLMGGVGIGWVRDRRDGMVGSLVRGLGRYPSRVGKGIRSLTGARPYLGKD